MTIDWSKAPPDATHARGPRAFRKKDLDGSWLGWRSYDKRWQRITKPYPERYTARLPAVAWNGEGLPPVGLQVKNNLHGTVMVLAHGVFRGQDVVICQGDDTIITCTPDSLSPFRTAEQIAADERKTQILEMIGVFGLDTSIWGLDTVREICGHLWEAGYRKQEQSK